MDINFKFYNLGDNHYKIKILNKILLINKNILKNCDMEYINKIFTEIENLKTTCFDIFIKNPDDYGYDPQIKINEYGEIFLK